ncbi:MAG TPA: glycosyltransferase family 2 protein [Bacillota bacterium]|nr:glycosyltransferase family 2 protein [Bacillota bacterium]HQD52909.1 glycosyltransferase family 2 protein [Bacillota bacterium]
MDVAAIVPAYNEEKTIGAVLGVLTKCRLINEVIVVSDGSTDDTVKIALQFDGVQVVELPENRGKGGAMKAGLEQTAAEIVLFLDADLIGLTEDHVNALLQPVLENQALMSLGVFEKGRVATDLAQKVAPYLSGQRALQRDLLSDLSDLDLTRFGVEVALHRYMEENKIPVALVNLPDLSHLMKEEKLGLWKGLAARGKMYWEIIKYAASIDLHLK